MLSLKPEDRARYLLVRSRKILLGITGSRRHQPVMANDAATPGPLDYSRVPGSILREVLENEKEGVDLFDGNMFYEVFGWKHEEETNDESIYETFRKESTDE